MMKMEDIKVTEEGDMHQIDNHFNHLFNKNSWYYENIPQNSFSPNVKVWDMDAWMA